jgi:glycosyltransferase involved in cell wall biosynthesis
MDDRDLRVLLWYWGKRGGGCHYTAGLAESLSGFPGIHVEATLSTIAEGRARIEAAVARTYPLAVHTLRGAAGVGMGLTGLRRVLSSASPDVVLHTMVNPLTPLGLRSIRRTNVHVVTVVHDARPHRGDEHLLMDRAVRTAIRQSDGLIAPSDEVAGTIASMGPCGPILTFPLGHHMTLPDLWDSNGGVLFFGRLREYKGLDLLADAWGDLPHRAGIELRIVGEGADDLHGLHALRKHGALITNAWVSDLDLAKTLSRTRLIVLPYREATQSGVIEMARAARIPVLTTDVGAFRRQVGPMGLVVPPTVEGLKNGLHRLLSRPEDLAQLHEALVRANSSLDDVSPLVAFLRQCSVTQTT